MPTAKPSEFSYRIMLFVEMLKQAFETASNTLPDGTPRPKGWKRGVYINWRIAHRKYP